MEVHLEVTDGELRVIVRDDGIGLPDGFDIDTTSSLGLSIVRSLVGSQMGGTIAMYNDPVTGGAVIDIVVPVDQEADGDLTAI